MYLVGPIRIKYYHEKILSLCGLTNSIQLVSNTKKILIDGPILESPVSLSVRRNCQYVFRFADLQPAGCSKAGGRGRVQGSSSSRITNAFNTCFQCQLHLLVLFSILWGPQLLNWLTGSAVNHLLTHCFFPHATRASRNMQNKFCK